MRWKGQAGDCTDFCPPIRAKRANPPYGGQKWDCPREVACTPDADKEGLTRRREGSQREFKGPNQTSFEQEAKVTVGLAPAGR